MLDELDEIQVCIGYRIRGEVVREFPSRLDRLEVAEPVLETLKGWRESTVGVLDEARLPRAARDYIAFLEEQVGASFALVSTGPRREETLLCESPRLAGWLGPRLAEVLAQRAAVG